MDNICWTARHVPVPGLGDLLSEACGPENGPPVLLVMGAMNPGHFWPAAFVAALVRAGCRVVRYDHRDTGRSFVMPTAAPPYPLDDLVADAGRVIDAWGMDRAAVVGWSMGGYIAQHLAREHPERVSRLVLLASSPDHRPYMAATMGRPVPLGGLPGPVPALVPSLLAVAGGAQGRAPEDVAVEGWAVFHGGSHPFPAARGCAGGRVRAHTWGCVACSSCTRKWSACSRVLPHISSLGGSEPHTAGRSGRPNS